MKFKFNYSKNKLTFIQFHNLGENHQEIPGSQRFSASYGGYGFQLDPTDLSHWITFTIFKDKINCFYKKPVGTWGFLYYRQEVPKQEEIAIEFTDLDMVEKDETGKWVYKGK